MVQIPKTQVFSEIIGQKEHKYRWYKILGSSWRFQGHPTVARGFRRLWTQLPQGSSTFENLNGVGSQDHPCCCMAKFSKVELSPPTTLGQ